MLVIDIEPRESAESIGVVHAVDEIGKVWRVACDWRPFENIAAAVATGEDVEIDPEPWAILGFIGVQQP